ncbi:hypothetical protein ACFVS2_20750 [Brevibacillus sp. NPDC058079]|uniref:hypothetical protein n=1 Tax=Brevibacillus sp. NPDC058079 TaxID=3346330 RepID=UPI0036E0674C
MFEQIAMRSIDLALFLDIYDELKESEGDNASEILLSSSFLQVMKKDPEYAQCQGLDYWVAQITQEWKDNH